MKHPAIQSLALAALAILARAENHIPFPDALEAASVHQERATGIMSQAFPIGNGDLNALLWDRDGASARREVLLPAALLDAMSALCYTISMPSAGKPAGGS